MRRDKSYKAIALAMTSAMLLGQAAPVFAAQPGEPVAAVDMSMPEVKAAAGRKWIKIQSGGGGGHQYGVASANAPALLLNQTKNMEVSKELSLTLKPSDNWGVFYTYVDDTKWLYIGKDGSTGWYFQYQNGSKGAYPKITGLPAITAGEEIQLKISLNRETLAVTVNDTTVRVTNQDLLDLGDAVGSSGKFGVKTNGASTISFADMTYDGQSCMEDTWEFCATRNGQTQSSEVSPVFNLTGTITDENGDPMEGAVVRVGFQKTVTNAEGQYTLEGFEAKTFTMAVTKPGYLAYSGDLTITDTGEASNVKDIQMTPKPELNLENYDTLQSDEMKVYIGKNFPVVARYQMLDDGTEVADQFFRGNESELTTLKINGAVITPTVSEVAKTSDSKTYKLACKGTDDNAAIDLELQVKVSVEGRNLTWQVIDLKKNTGCPNIASIEVPDLNLLTIDAVETGANFAGAQTSTTTTASGDRFIDFDNGFMPMETDGYLYGFLQNGKLSAGLFSNSEAEGDKRVVRKNGADTISLNSAKWYYEMGDAEGQQWLAAQDKYDSYVKSELPCTKVAIAADLNGDGDIDWNDGALAFREIMNIPYGSEHVKDTVNHRIVMNFASMAPNPFLATADNIKKVYLHTDGLRQSVVLKGYGNEGHDSANSEYADIAEREGGVEDFQKLIQIAHDYNTEIGIHINAQEAYPEAASFNEEMLKKPIGNGWGWLDQSKVIDKNWDLASQARWKRLVQLYDRINGTSFYDRAWPLAVENSLGNITATREEIKADAESREDNMDFIYLDVWYEDAWETRRIAEEFRTLGWRFTTEFSAEGEYDSTWQHWSTDAAYGGATAKGFNSSIIRFIRNDQRDSQVLNYPTFEGTADNPLLGGYRLYGFEGWGGDKSYENYIFQTYNQNLPTRFLQHYFVTDWEEYGEGETSPAGNKEKKITLKNEQGDTVVVERKSNVRRDENIERTIKLNGKKVLDEVTYLLPWEDKETGEDKLYHWNMDGGVTTWDLTDGWNDLASVTMYELSDQGRINPKTVQVVNGQVTLDAEAATPYVLVKNEFVKELKNDFGEMDYVVDPGFNGYAEGEKLSADEWSGDIADDSVEVNKAATGDQRLAFMSPESEVAVTTTISGLEPGEDYVAEVYVQNESDAAATITVDAGEKTVSNWAGRSFVMNYVKCDNKNGSQMQRMQVSFVAESEEAQLTLSRDGGEGNTYMDDIRIVKKALDNYKEDGSFEQDFETVVQGLYPFVLSAAQGINDPRTHLSQLHAPYTQKGWLNKPTDDVIEGEWSLKHHTNSTGIIYQTLPQNFRFEPGKVYEVEFDYQTPLEKKYVMVVGNENTYSLPAETYRLPAATTTAHHKMEVVGGGNGQTWIGLYMNGAGLGDLDINNGAVDFTLDNLVIREKEGAIAVTLDKTELYKGEVAHIYGSGLDQITWNSSDEAVARVDADASQVAALSAGTATLTATLPDQSTQTFTITVKEEVVSDLQVEGMTAEGNTGETVSENAGPEKAVDGSSSTFWHSTYNPSKFNVTAATPAILTVDLKEAMTIGGFKFQQRPSANNGLVKKFSYAVKAADGTELYKSGTMSVPESSQTGGAWTTVLLEEAKEARYIVISVEEGQGGYAAIAEVVPVKVERLADSISLPATQELKAGNKVKLQPEYAENTIVKGLVWTSSDAAVASVDQNGVVKGLKAGKTTITAKNAVGLTASCEVTVTGGAAVVTPREWIFTDLPKKPGEWKYDAASYLYDRKIMNGLTNSTLFAPNRPLTRQEFAAILHRMAGEPQVAYTATFSDVPNNGAWYVQPILWLAKEGIAGGIGEGKFGRERSISRAEIAKMVHQYAEKYQKMDVSKTASLSSFLDVKDVKTWAEPGLKWAVGIGMISGRKSEAGASLAPNETATRAEIAKMVSEFMKDYQPDFVPKAK